MQKFLLLLFFTLLVATVYGQEQQTSGSPMPITISNCKFTWGILKYSGCYGAAQTADKICIGKYQFRQSIDKDNMVTTTQIFIIKNGITTPKLCDAKKITEDW